MEIWECRNVGGCGFFVRWKGTVAAKIVYTRYSFHSRLVSAISCICFLGVTVPLRLVLVFNYRAVPSPSLICTIRGALFGSPLASQLIPLPVIPS